jgi:hypothetical protein
VLLIRMAFQSMCFAALRTSDGNVFLKKFAATTTGRSAWIISRLKNTVDWFLWEKKYCSGWKNKLDKTDYKPDEQGQRPPRLRTCTVEPDAKYSHYVKKRFCFPFSSFYRTRLLCSLVCNDTRQQVDVGREGV